MGRREETRRHEYIKPAGRDKQIPALRARRGGSGLTSAVLGRGGGSADIAQETHRKGVKRRLVRADRNR